MSNDTNSWDNWRVPMELYPKVLCFEGNLSSIAFDSYVFGPAHYEIYVEEGHFMVADKHSYRDHLDDEVVARLPLPATFDEVVTWARMVAAIHAADRDPRDDGYPF